MCKDSHQDNSHASCSASIIWMTLGFCVSWYFNHSIAWGILHAFLGIPYLAYKAIWYFITYM